MTRTTPMRRAALYASTLMVLVTTAAAADAQPLFSKSFNSATIGPGSVSTLTFTIDNTGSPTAVSGLAFSDPLPAGVTIADPAVASTTCGAAALDAVPGGSTIALSAGTLAGGASCTVRVDVTSSVFGIHANASGDLTSSAGNSGPATADLTVSAGRPGFTKSFAPSLVQVGGTSTLTLTIDNTADEASHDLLTFTDNLPVGVTIANPAGASTTCTGGVLPVILTAPAGGSSISMIFGFVGSGATCTVTVNVVAATAGRFDNVTGELSFNGNTCGKASATLVAGRGLLGKQFLGDPVAPGGTVTLRFTLTNFDRDDPATSIAFTDDLDAALSGLAAVPPLPAEPCGAGSTLTGTSLLTLAGGSLGPGESCSFDVTVQVPAGAAPGVYLNATSDVTADVGGVPVVEPPAVDDLVVEAVPLATKQFTDDPAIAGGTVTLEFSITNTSSTDGATGIAFTDDLSATLPGLAAVGLPAMDVCGAGSQLAGTTTLSLTGGNLPAGGSCTFQVTLQLPAGATAGNYTNLTSAVDATVGGEAVSGPPAEDDLVVVGAPALTKQFTDDPVAPGGTVTLLFTLSYGEAAPAGATGIAFTDDLAAALAGLTAVGLPAMDVCGAGSEISGTTLLTFTGGSLGPGESCSFPVTLQVPAGALPGSYPNTTSQVTATSGGEAVTGPAATDDLDVAALTFAKQFIGDPVVAGATVVLRFTVVDLSPSAAAGLTFTDDLGAALAGLAAIGLPAMDVCGTGSEIAGTTTLVFTGGNLPASGSCSFDVLLQVPGGAAPGEYTNTTTQLAGTVGGEPETVAPAADTLTVVAPLSISKQFTDDPVVAGGTVTLEFTIANADPAQPATSIGFTDDLDAALSGLAAVGLPLNDVCGAGSQISGTSLVTLTGGNLPAGGSCTFQVTLQVPGGVPFGTTAVNTTSAVTGTIGGVGVSGDPATDALRISFFTFTKAFDGPGSPGGAVILTFTITNLDTTAGAAGLAFIDDLGAVLPGLVATGLPASGVCGAGSQITGTSVLMLSGGNLGPGGSCSFGVTLQVPGGAAPGSYPNTTSELTQSGVVAAQPAVDDLVIEPPPGFAKGFTPAAIGLGGVSVLTLTVDNTASTVAATGLDVTDDLPAGVAVASPANASTTCTGGTITATPGSGTVAYTGGTVGAGETCTVVADVTGIAAGAHVNVTGELTSSSGSSGTATATLVVDPQPGFAKSFAPDPIAPGGVSTLTFTIDNSGSTNAATGLDFTDALPAALVVANPANASTTCTGGTVTAAPGTGTVAYTGGAVAAGAGCTVTADVTGTAPGTHLNVSGALTSSLGSSGTASDELTIVAGVVGFAKAFAAPVLRGGLVDLAFTVTNTSATFTLTDIAFSDDLGAVVPGLAAVGLPAADVCGAGSELSGTTVVSLTGGTLAPGASCTVTATVRVPADAPLGSFTNTTGQLTALAAGAPVEAPPASAMLEILFLEIAKEFDPDTVEIGQTTLLTFTITNPDPLETVTDVAFSDDLDAAVAGMVAVDTPQSDVCGAGSQLTGTAVVSLSGGSLGPGASCSFAVTVAVPLEAPPATYTNLTGPLSATVAGQPVTGDGAGAAQADLVVTGNPVIIPTQGPIGLAALAALLALAAAAVLRRRAGREG